MSVEGEAGRLTAAIDAYDRLLAAIGRRADERGTPVAGHWPHVGSAYDGLMIVGQAVYGWGDQNDPAVFNTAEGRASAIASYRRSAEVIEPMQWITGSDHRASPWWTTVRLLVDRLAPGPAPWYARFAWANLYPCALDKPTRQPDGRPSGGAGPARRRPPPCAHRAVQRAGSRLSRWPILVAAPAMRLFVAVSALGLYAYGHEQRWASVVPINEALAGYTAARNQFAAAAKADLGVD